MRKLFVGSFQQFNRSFLLLERFMTAGRLLKVVDDRRFVLGSPLRINFCSY